MVVRQSNYSEWAKDRTDNKAAGATEVFSAKAFKDKTYKRVQA